MRTPFLLVLAAVMICGSALAQPAPPAPAQTPAITAPVAPAPPDPVVQAAPLPEAHDLSPLGMYRKADWVVKSVMITLLVASFLTWTVWLFKTVELALARWRVRRAGRELAARVAGRAPTRRAGLYDAVPSFEDLLGGA